MAPDRRTLKCHFPLLLMLLLLANLTLSGCATNPVTGDQDFVLMSEDAELSIGRQNNPKILKEFGYYDNKALQAYVQGIGDRLAAVSHRPNLVYRFTVLDSQDVNAFALPGGYVYITRGLLAYLNSEAELAAVLGHEIGHVTARHGVRQQSATAATGLVAAILAASTNVRGANDAFNALGTALVRGYGRDQELEADGLGAQYMARAGYDPRAMLNVLRILKDQESFEKQLAKKEGRDPHIYHGVFATHPDNDTRLQKVVMEANHLKISGHPLSHRDRFLHEIEGLVFGDSEKDGILRGRNFYHKALGIAVRFPARWRVKNTSSRLLAIAPMNVASLQITVTDINRRISPREFMLQRMKLSELTNGEQVHQGEINGYTAIADARTPYGTRRTRFVVLYLHNKAYIFAGAAKDTDKPFQFDNEIINTAKSFHVLRPAETALATALKVHIITADGQSFAQLAQQSRISNSPEQQLRLLNGLYPKGEPRPGQLLKIVK